MTTSPTDRDLLAAVVDQLRDRVSGTVGRTAVGERLVAVTIEDEVGTDAGVAHRPPAELAVPVPPEPLDLARWAFDPPSAGGRLERALGLAAMNALSAPSIAWSWGDPMESLAGSVDRIATIGLFRPAFRKFDAVEVRVVEREPVGDIDAPRGVSVSVYPPSEADGAIAGVDVLFVTGSALVYGGTGAYLQAAVDVPTVVLIGSTASFLPDPAFAAGVTTMAGVRVTDTERVLAGVEAGLCGTDLHDVGLKKGFVTADSDTPGLDLGSSMGARGR